MRRLLFLLLALLIACLGLVSCGTTEQPAGPLISGPALVAFYTDG